jgi:hypothetical protein
VDKNSVQLVGQKNLCLIFTKTRLLSAVYVLAASLAVLSGSRLHNGESGSPMTNNELEQKEHELLDLEIAVAKRELELKNKLPHLHAFRHYKWSRRFFESRNKENFLIAANQVGKSSIQIRKAIHWATHKPLWKKLWPHLTPNQFWYLYPSKDIATAEFYTKWKQFLPKDKDDAEYGYTVEMERKLIKAIHFNSGVVIYFKSYSQDVMDLQAGSVFAIFCDEELPLELLGELSARLNATDGYFHMAFTATLGQDYWRRTMNANNGEKEEHSEALKIQASLYDCLEYEDGSRSHWTAERIQRIEAKCPTWTDVQIRVHGRFAKAGGRKYEAYDEQKNRTANHPLPKDWNVYVAVDIGSGGETGHPSAIVFIAVDPLYRRGRVFKAWRGDGIRTTSADVYIKYLEMRGTLDPVLKVYDYSSAEFKQITESAGDYFEPAEKKHDVGERIINTLFKHEMLSIQLNDPELDKLSTELCTILKTQTKIEANDDLADALRYCAVKIPWDFSFLDGMPVTKKDEPTLYTDDDRRRGRPGNF